MRSLDPAAAEQTLAAIKYRSLPRCYRRKCFFENNLTGVVRRRPDHAGNRRRPVADLHFSVDARYRSSGSIQLTERAINPAAVQLIFLADHDALRCFIDLDDVKRLARRDAQTSALPDGHAVNAAMLPETLPDRSTTSPPSRSLSLA